MRKLLEPCEHSKSRQRLLSTHSAQFNQLKYLWGELAPHHAFARAKAEAAELDLVRTSYTPGSVWRGLQTCHRGYAVREAEVDLINLMYDDMVLLNSDVLDQGNKTARSWNAHLKCVKSGRVLIEQLEQKGLDGDKFDLVKYKLSAWYKAMAELTRSCPLAMEQYIQVRAYDTRIIEAEDALKERVDQDAHMALEVFAQLEIWNNLIDLIAEQLNHCDASLQQIKRFTQSMKARSAAQDLEDVLDGQAKWLEQLRIRAARPSADDLLSLRKELDSLRETLAESAANVKRIEKMSDWLSGTIPLWINEVTKAATRAGQGYVFEVGGKPKQIKFNISSAELKSDKTKLLGMRGVLKGGAIADIAKLYQQWRRASDEQGPDLKGDIQKHLSAFVEAERLARAVKELLGNVFTTLREYDSQWHKEVRETGAGVARYAAANFTASRPWPPDKPDNPSMMIDIVTEAEAAVQPLRRLADHSVITQGELAAYKQNIEACIKTYTRMLKNHARFVTKLSALRTEEMVARNKLGMYQQTIGVLNDVVATLRILQVPVTVPPLATYEQQLAYFAQALAKSDTETVAAKRKQIDNYGRQIRELLDTARRDIRGEINRIRADIRKMRTAFTELVQWPGLYTTYVYDAITDASWLSASLNERAIQLQKAADNIPSCRKELHDVETLIQNYVRNFLDTFRQDEIEAVITEMGMDPEHYRTETKLLLIRDIVTASMRRGELERLYKCMKAKRDTRNSAIG